MDCGGTACDILMTEEGLDFRATKDIDLVLIIDGVTVLDAAYLIPFKEKAWMDLTDRKAAGEHVDSKKIKKHKNDVFRLTELIDPTSKVMAPQGVYEDIQILSSGCRRKALILSSWDWQTEQKSRFWKK